MLIFQMKRITLSEKSFNYVVTFFFLKMPKIWVGRTTLNGERKEDGLKEFVIKEPSPAVEESNYYSR